MILTPQAMTDPTQTAEAAAGPRHRSRTSRCSPAGWAVPTLPPGEAILNRANIPTFAFPDTAAHMFNYMWHYNYNLRSLYETPILPMDSYDETPDRATVERASSSTRSAPGAPS